MVLLSTGIEEFISYRPAPLRTPPSKSSGLAAQLATMDPVKLKEVLAIVNGKLQLTYVCRIQFSCKTEIEVHSYTCMHVITYFAKACLRECEAQAQLRSCF